jgi:hypothetical protein
MLSFGTGKRKWFRITAAALICAGVVLVIVHFLKTPVVKTPGNRTSSSAGSFDGPSTSLEQTVIVPTLDTPLPEGKSAVWCASFQLAWDRLKKDVAKGPLKMENAQVVADRLNSAEYPEDGLDPASYYAAAGLMKDGIVKKILSDMAQRFPDGLTPELSDATVGTVAYGYLKAGVKYSIPFFENDEAFTFTDSVGNRRRVRSFGLRPKDEDRYLALRKQVSILYYPGRSLVEQNVDEFVLDPCKDSQPHQLVLARVDRKATLAETLANVEKKIKENPPEEWLAECLVTDILLVPNMRWRALHHFKELEGTDKALLNPLLKGLYMHTALQTIDFRMDRGGAEVASEAKMKFKSQRPRLLTFNRPFLVVMKKRGGSAPFFVMWVENAELMQAW